MWGQRLRPLTHLQAQCESQHVKDNCTGLAVACSPHCSHWHVYENCPVTTLPAAVTCVNCQRTISPMNTPRKKTKGKTKGEPSVDRDHLERIRIRPSQRRKSLADVGGNGFIAEPFYTPYPLRRPNGSRKYFLFSGETRDTGYKFVAIHADNNGWRADWVVIDPAGITSSLPEFVIT